MRGRIKKRVGWIAGILVVVVIVGIFLSQEIVWASDAIPNYSVELINEEKIGDVKITFTKQSDEEEKKTVSTNGNGIASFDSFLEDGQSYILSIEEMKEYYIKKVKVIDGTDDSETEEEIKIISRGKDGGWQCEITNVKMNQRVEIEVEAKEKKSLSELVDSGIVDIKMENGDEESFIMDQGEYIASDTIKITGKNATSIGYKADKGNIVFGDTDPININLEQSTVLEELYIQDSDGNWIDYILDPKAYIVIDKIEPEVSLKGPKVRWTNGNKEEIIEFTAEDIGEEGGMPCAGLGKDAISIKRDDGEEDTQIQVIQSGDKTYQFSVSNVEEEVTYKICVKDKVGNPNERCSVTIKIDKNPPEILKIDMETEEGAEIEYTEEATKSWKTITLKVTAEDKESGVDKIKLKMIGKDSEEVSVDENGTAVFKLEQSNEMQIIKEIICVDQAGNEIICEDIKKQIPDTVRGNIKSNNVLVKEVEKTSVNFSYQIEGDVDQIFSVPSQEKQIIAVKTPEGKVLQVAAEETENPQMGFKYIQIGDLAPNETKAELDSLNLDEGDNEIKITVMMQGGQIINDSVIIRYDTEKPAIKEIKAVDPSDSTKDLDNRYVFKGFGTFFNEKTKIVVRAEDNTGVRKIQLFVNGEKYGEAVTASDGKAELKAEFDVPKALLQQTVQKEYFNGSISALAVDQVGNESPKTNAESITSNLGAGQFMIENVPPVITCTVPEAVHGGSWYGNDIDFSIDVKDQNSGLYHVKAVLNGKTVKEVTSESDYGRQKKESDTFAINTGEAQRAKDGSYTLSVTVEDNAGNKSTVSKKIYVDTQKPEITSFEFEAEGYNEGKKTDLGVSEKNYGYYFSEKTKVTVRAKDSSPSSGLKSITYYTVDKDKKKSEEKTETVSSSGSITFMIPANFKGQVYAKPTDNVNHSADHFVTPDSAVIENNSQHKEDSAITFTKPKTDNKDKNGRELYKKDVTVTIKVSDRYSGIRKVEYSVTAPYDTEKNLKGEIEIDNAGEKKQGSASGWQRTGKEKNLVTELTGKVKVSNNSNDIVVKVKMTDRAGHITTESNKFSIDKTNPVIRISYDNNKDDKEFEDFYKEKRTATVIITERNFDAEDVKYQATNKDGDVPPVDLTEAKIWVKKADKKNPDQTTYTAKIPFNEDGLYTWSLSFEDMADNKAAKVGKQEYTIDQTAPVVTVVYDNENASNGIYFNKNRTATITIEEHNFEDSRVKIKGNGKRDGKKVAFPEVMGWSNNGDTHTATILYSQDAEYSFEIAYTDKAGNKAEAPAEDRFIIDQIKPEINISGVENETAYKQDKLAPIITYKDINLESSTLDISLKGARRQKVDVEGETKEIKNGEEFTFKNFEKKSEFDDIYTLTVSVKDKAGNKSEEKTVCFSVNRFGSTYTFEKEELISMAAEIKKGEESYFQNEFDVVIKEINVDELKEKETKIRMSKNGITSELVEDEDYSVDHPDGGSDWRKRKWSEYTYHIIHQKFSDDARYTVMVRSIDKAENKNDNTENASIQFVIDKTAPNILPIDLKNDTQYALDSKEVKIEINDNLNLSEVRMYLNDSEVSYENEEDNYTITIPGASVKQNLRIVARDAAGNEQTETIEGFLVSTNLFVRWYNNLPLFAGTLAGLGILIVLIVILIIMHRIKKKEAVQ